MPSGFPFHARDDDSNTLRDLSLDDFETLVGRPIVTRHGSFRRSFRQNGPEIGESQITNG